MRKKKIPMQRRKLVGLLIVYTQGENKLSQPYNMQRSPSGWAPNSQAETLFTLSTGVQLYPAL